MCFLCFFLLSCHVQQELKATESGNGFKLGRERMVQRTADLYRRRAYTESKGTEILPGSNIAHPLAQELQNALEMQQEIRQQSGSPGPAMASPDDFQFKCQQHKLFVNKKPSSSQLLGGKNMNKPTLQHKSSSS